MTPRDYREISVMLSGEANKILAELGIRPADAYARMLHEPSAATAWWTGAFEQSEADQAALQKAAIAFAKGSPLPDLSIPQRARLALRLRLGSRIARALSDRHEHQPTGWFPDQLRRLSERKLLLWILVDAWDFLQEVFDETLLWAEGVVPPTPYIRESPPASSSQDLSSLAE